MLGVQVQYWSMIEAKRHNQETESQGRVALAIDRFNAETNRKNAYTNEFNAQTNRYNAETNRLNYGETVRHNLATEQLQSEANTINAYRAETDRLNYGVNAANAQTNRYNAETQRMMVPIQATIAAAQMSQANTAEYRAAVSAYEAVEDVRIRDEQLASQRFNNVISAGYSSSNVDIAKFNADTNRQNATTNAFNAETERTYKEGHLEIENIQTQQRTREIQLEEEKLNLDMIKTGLKGMEIFIDGINNAWRNAK